MDAMGGQEGSERFVEEATSIIDYRARYAGMEFDPGDIVTAHDDGTMTTFLRRTRRAIYDDDDQFVKWEYTPLIWMEYMKPRTEVVNGRVNMTRYTPRVVMRCPWLVMMRLPDGTIRDGGKVGLSW